MEIERTVNEYYLDCDTGEVVVVPEELQRLLEVALDGKGAFGRFRRVLANYPEEREEWFRIKDDALHVMARDWLSSMNADKG